MRRGPLGTISFLLAITLLPVERGMTQESTYEPCNEHERVRALFRDSPDAADAGKVLHDAFGDDVERWVAAFRSAPAEEDVLGLVESLPMNDFWEAGRERLLLEAAIRLRFLGTSEALPFLNRLRARPAVVVVRRLACSDYESHAVFNYPFAARRAEFAILERDALKEFEELGELDGEARVRWFLDARDAEVESPRLSASLRALRGLDEELQGTLRRRLLSTEDSLTAAAGEFLAEIYLASDVVPAPEEFARLPRSAALRFLEEIAGGDGEEDRATYRSRVLAVARSHAGVASRAAFLDSGDDPLPARPRLERDGPSAASLLSRDRSLAMTASLAGILSDSMAPEPVRRHAAFALIHQKTEAARAFIEAVLSSEELSEALARKLERWLES